MDVDAIEVFKQDAHLAETSVERFCRKFDVVLGVARAHECESSIVGRRDAEDGTVIDHAEHARAVLRLQPIRLQALLRLRLNSLCHEL